MSVLDREYTVLEIGGLGCATHLGALARAPKPFALPGDAVHRAPDRLVDARHIRIEVSFSLEQRKVMGRTSTTLVPINDGLDHIELDAIDLNVKEVRLSDGHPLRFSNDGRKLRIELDRAYNSAEELAVVVEYDCVPRRGLYFNVPDTAYPGRPWQIWTQGEDEDNRHWFPCHDFPNEKATSEVIATVPEAWFALSNGRLVEVSHDREAETKTYHWHQTVPHVSYLITLVAGEFTEVTDSYDGIPVQYYVPPGREEEARRSFGNTPDMLKFFSEQIGVKYPYEKYAQIAVTDFIFGGMENTSATTQTDTTLHDERAHLDFRSEPLVAHELAHQWFGDLLTCRDWSHGWLNEGFATYFDALWHEHHEGRDEFLYRMLQNAEAYFDEDQQHYRRPIVQNVYHAPIDIFDRHLYEKGSLVLHMLRYVLGEDLFWKSIQHYTRKHQMGNVVTLDLQRAIEEATGKNLEGFFEQWVYKAGHPEFKVTYAWDEEAKLARLTVAQTQETNETTPLFQTPIDVELTSAQGKTSRRIQITQKEETFHFPLAEKPLLVRFDPDNWVLKGLTFDKPKELLLYQIKNDAAVIERIRAAESLAKLGSLDAIEAIKQTLLHDPFWGVQARCARALGTVRSKIALEALLEGLKVEHPKARRAVVAALGEFKDQQAADALIGVLEEGDASYFVEAEAARALGKTRNARAFEALERAMAKESWQEVIRNGVLEGFAELKDDRALPIAKEWSQYGKPQPSRGTAVAIIGTLAKDAENKPKAEAVDHLIDLLDDYWLRVRLAAVGALEKLGEDRAIGPIQRLVDREFDGRVIRRGREAIAKLREGRGPQDEAKKLREDLDKLSEENRALRDRLDKIEARLNGQKPAEAATTP